MRYPFAPAATSTILVGFLSLITACSTKAPEAQTAAKKSEPACAALPGTGLCQDRAKSLLALAGGERPAAPRGCEWIVNELAMPGDEYLLYLSAKCGESKVTTLDYAGGAHKAILSYATSAQGGNALKGQKLVSIYGSDEKDPQLAVLNYAREVFDKPAEAKKCRVRPANSQGWPADALVVDVSAAEAAKAPKDEPRTACGPLGLDEDSQTYWRVFQGFSWFFELGQDEPEIDPGSLTLVHKDAQGVWTRV